MRITFISILFLISSFVYSQNVDSRSNKCSLKNGLQWQKGTTAERVIYTELAVIGVALSDVVLYPIAERSNLKDSYRMFQGALQLAISYLLIDKLGISSGVSFNLQLLTGVNDFIYYQFKPKEYQDTHFNHLNYTPFYLLNGGRLSRHDFKVQALTGFAISINLVL